MLLMPATFDFLLFFADRRCLVFQGELFLGQHNLRISSNKPNQPDQVLTVECHKGWTFDISRFVTTHSLSNMVTDGGALNHEGAPLQHHLPTCPSNQPYLHLPFLDAEAATFPERIAYTAALIVA